MPVESQTLSPDPTERPPFAAAMFRQLVVQRMIFAVGVVCLVLGAIGMVVPMMPATVFLIGAAWCFARTSPRFEAWLLANRYLGPSVVRWQQTGAIPLVVKAFSLMSFAGSFGAAWYVGTPVPVLWALGVFFAALAAFIVTRPSA